LLSATFTGANSQMFSLPGFTPGTILTKAQVDNLQVMFNPTAGASGTETAKLTLVTDEGAANGVAGKTISFSLSALAADQAYWKGAFGGNWNSTTPGYNWTTGTGSTTQVSALPTASTDVFFTANGQATSNTTLGQDFSVKSVTFSGNAPSTTIGGSNTLTIGTGLSVGAGTASHTINANVQLGATQNWTIGSGSTLTVGGGVGGNAALSKDGAGTLVVSGTNTYTGGTTVTSGTLQVANALSLPVGHDLTITGAGSVVALSSGLTSAVKIGGLSIDAGSATPLASFDLANNELIASASLESLATIRGQIVAAYSGGSWTGAGITSSTAATSGHGNTAIGFASNADSGMGLTSFGGIAVDANSVLLRYTMLGDANLDGKVDIADFLLLRHNFGLTSNAMWDQGDFDYDGKIDITDFMILRAHFGASLSAAPAAIAQMMALPALAEFQAVPEPESIKLLIAAGLALGAGMMASKFRHRKREATATT
jgi:autotransporter-associated beta strand protein